MAEIIDFSDLAEDVKFAYKGTVYVIPPISNGKAKELFKIGKEGQKKSKEITESIDGVGKEIEEDSTDFYDNFITAVVTFENGSPVTKEHINEVWPMKLSLKVVKLINECISSVDEGTEEAKN